MTRTDEIAGIINTVSERYCYEFCPAEIRRVLGLTERKCRAKGKGDDYLPLLLETELKEYLTSIAINNFWRRPNAGNYRTENARAGVC